MEQFISIAELARQCGVAAPTVQRLVKDGILVPDGKSNSDEILFAASRFLDLRSTINGNYGIGKAIRARREQLAKSGK